MRCRSRRAQAPGRSARKTTSSVVALHDNALRHVHGYNIFFNFYNNRSRRMRITLRVDGARSYGVQSFRFAETSRVLAPFIHVQALRRGVRARLSCQLKRNAATTV